MKHATSKDFPYDNLKNADEAEVIAKLDEFAEAEKKERYINLKDVIKLNEVLMYMRYAFGYQDCNLSYVLAFTTIAKHAPIQLSELPDKLNISRTTITRLISYLGEGMAEGPRPLVGLNYVKTTDDLLDSRRKLVSLTPAGLMVAGNVQRLLNDGATFDRLMMEKHDETLAASKRYTN
jgi:DNA-binding MarR family transcriptional regulator